MEVKNRFKIDKLPDEIYKANNFIELKRILFRITQERYGVRDTTGINDEIKSRITKSDLIRIANNFKGKNEKKELIKLLNLKEITFKDVTQIFEANELIEIIKEFNIKVSKNEIEELYKFTNGKDHELIQLLLEMSVSDKKTITEIVLDNIKDESIIDYIRNFNLKLTNEQLDNIITTFENKNISVENSQFLETLSQLFNRNDELTETINYQIISKKYQNLEKYMPIITCHPELQGQILVLSDNELNAFTTCMNSYSSKTQDWTPVAVGILSNIEQYSELINKLDIEQMHNEEIELFTKLLTEPNYFNITNIDEYFEKRDKVCESILKDPNNKDLEEFSLISEMSEKDRIKFAVLEKNFGLSLEQAQVLINKFGDDIETISELGENAIHYRGLIRSLKFICDDENINQISDISFETDNRVINAAVVEREIKDIYDRDYVSQLYRPIEEDFEREEDDVKIYKAGKSTDGKFIMETHSPGAVYVDEYLKKGQFKESWNRPKMKSQAFCTVTGREDMLIATKIPALEYGFYDYEKGSLRGAGYEDVSSDAMGPVIFLDEDEKYCSVDTKINKTRNINENDRSRLLSDGTKKQPDYVRYRKSRFIDDEVAKSMWENSKKACKQFGIPMVVVDQDECTKKQNEELQDMLQEFNKSKNPELISKIIVKFENNRKGNDFGKINGKPRNTDFELDGPCDTLTRNSMLLSLISTINDCKDVSVKKNLYKTLTETIQDEVKKVKIPLPKELNNIGIPIVIKEQLKTERYFATGRNKETGNYIYIEAYDKFIELGKTFFELNSEDKKIVNESNEYIESTKLIKDSMMHGIEHTKHVVLNSKVLANSEGITEKQSQLLLIAAMFHDVGREGIDGDNRHAEKSADIFKQHIKKDNNLINGVRLSDDDIKIIQIAIRYHEYKDAELQGKLDEQELKRLCSDYSIDWGLHKESIEIVSSLLKDADALDRTRFPSSKQSLNSKVLRTHTAKMQAMIEYSKDLNKQLAIDILKTKGIEVLDDQDPLEVLAETMKNQKKSLKSTDDDADDQNPLVVLAEPEENQKENLKSTDNDILFDSPFPITEGFLGATKRISENEISTNLMRNTRELKANYREFENPNKDLDSQSLED